MKLDDIFTKVQEIVYEQFAIKVNIDDILIENGFDSIYLVDLIVRIEELFNVEFELSKLNYKLLKSIRTIGEYIYELLDKDKSNA